MVKKVSLSIPDDIFKGLTSLSDFYKQYVKNVIISILDAISRESQWIINLSKEYKVPVELNTVISVMLDAAIHSIISLFNEVLEKLGVKGLFTLADLHIDLDENLMVLYYAALEGCNLYIDAFDIEVKPGLKTLTTTSYIEVEKVNKEILSKLKEIVRSQSFEVPEEFDDLEYYDIRIEEEEEFWDLKIDCTAMSFDYLPSVSRISEFVKQMFEELGITY